MIRTTTTLLILVALVASPARAVAPIPFTSSPTFTLDDSETLPLAVATHDLDNDGDDDVVYCTGSSIIGFNEGEVVVLDNQGGGSATPVPIESVGYNDCIDIVLYDVNGDGFADVVLSLDSDNIDVALNAATTGLTFAGLTTVLPSAQTIAFFALGLVDADMVPDLVVCFSSGPTQACEWRSGLGSGTFTATPSSSIVTFTTFRAAAAADVNADGRIDLALAASTGGTPSIAVHYANGTGTFTPSVISPVNSASALALVALHDTPYLSLVAITNSLTLVFANAHGVVGTTFVSPSKIPAGYIVQAALSGDVNNDGLDDVVVTAPPAVFVYLADHAGSLAPPFRPNGADVGSTLGAVATGVLAPFGSQTDIVFPDRAAGEVVVIGGSFTHGVSFNSPSTFLAIDADIDQLVALASADVDGSGTIDLVVASASGLIAWYARPTLDSSLFAPAATVGSVGLPLADMALTDLTADAVLDVAVVSPSSGTLFSFRGRGDGSFAAPVSTPSSLPSLIALRPASLNGDLYPDLVTISGQAVASFINNPAQPGTYTVVTADAGTSLVALAVGDVSGDGVADVVVGDNATDTVILLLNTGNGTLGAPAVVSAAPGVASIVLADVNSDGMVDVVLGSAGGQVAAVLATAVATFAAAPTPPLYDGSGVGAPITPATLSVTPLLGPTDGTVFVGHGSTFAWALGEGADRDEVAVTLPTALISAVLVWDVNGDGFADYVWWASQGGLQWLPSSPPFAAFPTTRVPSYLYPPALAPECGGVAGTLACLTARVSRTLSSVLVLPPSLPSYSHCARPSQGSGYLPLTRSVALVSANASHMVTVDCAPLGGVLWLVRAGVDVALDHVAIRATQSVSALAGASAGIFVGAGATLQLSGVHVSAAYASLDSLSTFAGLGGAVALDSSASLTVVDSTFAGNSAARGGGAVALVGAQATLTAVDSAFVGNVAEGSEGSFANGGGAVAVIGVGSTLSFTGSRFVSNTAVAGSGGAVLTDASAVSITANGCTFTSNGAPGGAGGAVFVAGGRSGGSSLTAWNGTVFASHTAGWGGTFAAAPSTAAIPDTLVATALGPATGAATVVVTLHDTTIVGSAAAYGGVALLSDALFNATDASFLDVSTASLAGGFAFYALPVGPLHIAPASAASAAGRYGPVSASPPTGLTLASPLAPSVPSGTRLASGSVTLTDAFANVVSDPDVTLEVGVTTPGFVVSAASAPGLDTTGANAVYSLADVIVSAADWPEVLDTAVVLDVSVADMTGGSSVSATTNVTACPPDFGRSSDDELPLVCSPCGEALFSVNTSTERCNVRVVCGGDAVFIDNVCRTCPLGAFRTTTNTSEPGPCACSIGFWTAELRLDPSACVPCPPGATCTGGANAPVALPGWHPTGPPASGEFARCKIDGACIGGGECAEAYEPGATNMLCRKCTSGTFRESSGKCVFCPDHAVPIFVFFIAVIAVCTCVALAFTVLLFRASAEALDASTSGITLSSFKSREKMIPHSVSVGLLYLQILGIVGVATLNFPSSTSTILSAASAANVDTSYIMARCTLTDYAVMYLFNLSLPLVFGLVVACALMVYNAVYAPPYKMSAVGVRFLFSAGPLLYVPISTIALVHFDCTLYPDGKWYLDAEPAIECFALLWFQLAVPAAVAVVLYVVALPAFLAFVLYRHSSELSDPAVFVRYSPIFAAYRRPYYYAELLQLLRRLAFVATSLFLSDAILWLLLSFAIITVVSLYLHTRTQPYYWPILNTLEHRLNVSLVTITIIGFCFWNNRFPNEGSELLLEVVATASLVASLGMLAVAAFSEVRSRRRVHASAEAFSQVREREMWRVVDRYVPDVEDEELRRKMFELRTGCPASLSSSQSTSESTVSSSGGVSSAVSSGSGGDDGSSEGGTVLVAQPSLHPVFIGDSSSSLEGGGGVELSNHAPFKASVSYVNVVGPTAQAQLPSSPSSPAVRSRSPEVRHQRRRSVGTTSRSIGKSPRSPRRGGGQSARDVQALSSRSERELSEASMMSPRSQRAPLQERPRKRSVKSSRVTPAAAAAASMSRLISPRRSSNPTRGARRRAEAVLQESNEAGTVSMKDFGVARSSRSSSRAAASPRLRADVPMLNTSRSLSGFAEVSSSRSRLRTRTSRRAADEPEEFAM